MLEWLTFVAALLAAVGAVIGPFIAYRASIKTIEATRQAAETEQRQETIDRLIAQATSANAVASSYAIAQLDYLLSTGRLSVEQTTAARNAIEAAMANLQPAIAAGVDVVEDDGSNDEQEGHN